MLFPRAVNVYITNDCVLECSHCFIVNRCSTPNYLELEKFKEIVNICSKNKVFLFSISGGEPLLHPDFFDMIKYVRKNNMLPFIGISGINISNTQIEMLADCNIGCVQVSLDGIDEKTNAIYRKKLIFKETLENIIKMQTKGIRVSIATCICNENYYLLEKLLELFWSIKAHKVKVQFYTKENNNSPHNEIKSSEKKEVIEKCHSFQVQNQIKDWIQCEMIETEPVLTYENRLTIMSDGSVAFGELSESIGNIFQENLENIIKEIK
ncbi:MAG: radical SAM protein [Defluviitaleaceae bacterium]|nr:radical SAM protein [Defluviitaleaceae bacterium]